MNIAKNTVSHIRMKSHHVLLVLADEEGQNVALPKREEDHHFHADELEQAMLVNERHVVLAAVVDDVQSEEREHVRHVIHDVHLEHDENVVQDPVVPAEQLEHGHERLDHDELQRVSLGRLDHHFGRDRLEELIERRRVFKSLDWSDEVGLMQARRRCTRWLRATPTARW